MSEQTAISPYLQEGLAILLVPLISFVIIMLLPARWKRYSGDVFIAFMVLAAISSIHLLVTLLYEPDLQYRFTWFTLSETTRLTAGILLDTEALIMLVTVTVISSMVGIFSLSYMHNDRDEDKYFAHLGLFVFSMTGIILSSNLLVLFCFWELVGFSSYLLINHWYRDKIPPAAATKAFIVNRVGDAAFLFGLAIVWSQLGTLELPELYTAMGSSQLSAGEWVSATGTTGSIWVPIAGILLFLGAAGKSAQFPFQAWLPDAMAGPTPVSALIHAATMVAAGVFLLARVFPLLALEALTIIAIAGSLTAFMGAVAAMTQHDIKKVLAFSTISQLGYMVMGIGVGSYDAALFHLFTHAFFKAGLFLAAGTVIHAMHDLSGHSASAADAQDMHLMGGLRKYMPLVFWSFVVLALALVGIPFFSGFLSKEAILSGSFAWADARGGSFSVFHLVPVAGMVTVALTAYYMARQVYLVFLGEERFVPSASNFQVPLNMGLPVVFLAVMSAGILWSFNPLSYQNSWFFSQLTVPETVVPGFPAGLQPLLVELSLTNHTLVFILSTSMILTGFGVAWARYRHGVREIGQPQRLFYRISFHNWGLDSIYHHGIVRPVQGLSRLSLATDRKLLDGLINNLAVGSVILAKITAWFDRGIIDGAVNLSARLSRLTGDIFRSVQGGNIQRYIAGALLLMIVLFWLIS